MDEIGNSSHRLVNFRLFYLITQMIGVTIIILVVSWIGIHLDGLGWDYEQPQIMFNWHPTLMTIGMVFLYGNCNLMSGMFLKLVTLSFWLWDFFDLYVTNFHFIQYIKILTILYSWRYVFSGHSYQTFCKIYSISLKFLAIMVYRGFRYARKKPLKITHALIHGFAFLFTVIALVAAFNSHNYAKPIPIPNLYTMHSWIGISAVVIFACQVRIFKFLLRISMKL